jgi:hypothetical protein
MGSALLPNPNLDGPTESIWSVVSSLVLDGIGSRIRQKGPMRTHSDAIFIGLRDIVGADRHQTAIGNFQFPMEFHKPFGLTPVFGTVASSAEHENHRMLALQFGEPPAFRSVVGKLIIGEHRSRKNVRSHAKTLCGFDALRRVPQGFAAIATASHHRLCQSL